jgi:hypothetical protein
MTKKPVNYTEIFNYLKEKGKPTLVGVDSNPHGNGGYNEIYFTIYKNHNINSFECNTGFNPDKTFYNYQFDKSWISKYKGKFYILDDETERTIDDVKYGDILVDVDGDTRKVLGRINDVVLLSGYNDFDIYGDCYIINTIKNLYTLKQPTKEPEVLEVTLEEVAKKFGVKNIKIIDK